MAATGAELSLVTPWVTEAVESNPPLRGEISADVAIIGAGYTGLSAAVALRREGFEVAVLEANTAGFGASGRNAGHLSPTIGKDLPTLIRLFGDERVRGLIAFTEAAISHVENLIETHEIACDYEPVGNVIAAVHPRQHARIDKAAEAAAKYGLPGELLDADAMRAKGLPRAFTRGYLEPHGGILNPCLYARGLREAAIAAGARIYENSPVMRIEEGEPAVVSTPSGTVRCPHVVIATNAYTASLGRLGSAGMRLQVQLLQTEPLSDEQLARVDWHGRQGVYTAHETLENYRLTADNRIVFGSKKVRYIFGGGNGPDTDPVISEFLESTFRARFPEISDVGIARHWGGPIFLGLDFLPVVGRNRNILHSIAYAGHGLAHASLAGEMIADLLLGRSGHGAALRERRVLPTPPEPFRWLAFRGLDAVLSFIDRRVDRAAASMPRDH